MKGSKGLYQFTVSEYENTDCLHITIGGEEAYIPMRDIYGAAETHKKDEAAKAMPEERAEKPATKLDHLLSKLRVYASDVNYLMDRMQQESLATIDEHLEVQAEIHELQRILADCDAYVSMSIGKFQLERWLRGKYMNQEVHREY